MHIHGDCLASTKLYYLMTQAQLCVSNLPTVNTYSYDKN